MTNKTPDNASGRPDRGITIALPDAWAVLPTLPRLRRMVALQQELIVACNNDARNQFTRWLPALYKINPTVARLRESLPLVKADPKIHPDSVLWVPAGGDRKLDIMATLGASERAFDIARLVPNTVEAPEPFDPYEDLSAFTEVDSDSDITFTGTDQCNFSTLRRDADSYVYDDYTASHFGNYDHWFEWNITSSEENNNTGLWCVTDDPGWFSTHVTNGQNCYVYSVSTSTLTTYLADWGLTHFDYDSGGQAQGTHYFCRAVRSGSSSSLEIRTGSRTGTLVDTLAITSGTTARRYLQALFSMDSATNYAKTATGWVKNVDIQEGSALPLRCLMGAGL